MRLVARQIVVIDLVFGIRHKLQGREGWVQSWNSRSTKDLNDQTNNRMENETSTEISWLHGLITCVLCLFNIV